MACLRLHPSATLLCTRFWKTPYTPSSMKLFAWFVAGRLLRPQPAVADEKLFWLLDYGADRGKSHSMIAGLWTVHPQSAGVLFLVENETAGFKSN